MDYYCHRIHYRPGRHTLHRGGRLFLQFIVDVYARIEQSSLNYIRFNQKYQKDLRSEVRQGLVDAIYNNTSLDDIGRSIILPSSFYNSPRFMIQQYQDMMAMVREFGKPDLFITFTCNPKWGEIGRELLKFQKPNDKLDLIARIFPQKMKCSCADLIENQILG